MPELIAHVDRIQGEDHEPQRSIPVEGIEQVVELCMQRERPITGDVRIRIDLHKEIGNKSGSSTAPGATAAPGARPPGPETGAKLGIDRVTPTGRVKPEWKDFLSCVSGFLTSLSLPTWNAATRRASVHLDIEVLWPHVDGLQSAKREAKGLSR
jgi:hypothetical protein